MSYYRLYKQTFHPLHNEAPVIEHMCSVSNNFSNLNWVRYRAKQESSQNSSFEKIAVLTAIDKMTIYKDGHEYSTLSLNNVKERV